MYGTNIMIVSWVNSTPMGMLNPHPWVSWLNPHPWILRNCAWIIQ